MHTIAVHCRMHAAALKQALLPLVQKLGQGADLGKALEEKVGGGVGGAGWDWLAAGGLSPGLWLQSLSPGPAAKPRASTGACGLASDARLPSCNLHKHHAPGHPPWCQLAEGERVLGALEGEKKHLGNEAFIAAWQAQKKVGGRGWGAGSLGVGGAGVWTAGRWW